MNTRAWQEQRLVQSLRKNVQVTESACCVAAPQSKVNRNSFLLTLVNLNTEGLKRGVVGTILAWFLAYRSPYLAPYLPSS